MNLAALAVSKQEPFVHALAGEVTQADLLRLGEAPAQPKPTLQRVTERHHAAARLVAAGVPTSDVAVITGYASGTVSSLKADPAFQELVSFYTKGLENDYQGMHMQMAGLGSDAIAELRKRMEEDPGGISLNSLIELVKLTADRTGHGPSTSTKSEINVNVGIADRLAEARRKATAAVIEGVARHAKVEPAE